MKKVFGFLLPLIFASILSVAFYHQFFTKHLIPAPLDIVPGMYLPWLDQRRDIFPNGGPVKNPLPSDVVSLTLPLRKIVIDSFKNHQWPLWNQFILNGTPLLANFQSAPFNPLNLLYFLPISFINIWSIQIILQSFLAFISFYIFINLFDLKPLAKILGSFFWAFNGFFILWFQYNTVVYAAIFLPLCLFCIYKIKNNFLWGFLLSFLLAFSVFAGNPPITLIVFGTSFLFILFTYWRDSKTIVLSLLFLFISLLYSSPQLIPGLIASKNSIRDTDNIAVSQNIKFLPSLKLITLIIPDFFGNPSTRNTWKDTPLYDNTTIYNGIFPIILFLLSFKIKESNPKKKKIWLFCLLISTISFVLMVSNPLSKLFGNLNFFGLSSMVFTRFSLLWSLALSIVTSLVFDNFQKHEIKFKDFIFPFIITLSSILTLALLTFVLNHFSAKFLTDYDWIAQTKTSFRNCLYPLAFTLTYIILVCSFYFFKPIKIQKTILIFIFCLSIFDIYRFFNKYNTFSSTNDFYPSSELTDFLSQNSFRFIRQSSELIPSNMWLMYPNLKTPSGYDTTYSQNYGQFISMINNKTLSGAPNRYLEIDNFSSPLINLLSYDYLIVTKKNNLGLNSKGEIPSSINLKNFEITKDFGDYLILKNNQSIPFVHPVSSTIYSQSQSETEKLLANLNIKSTAIINDPTQAYRQLNNNIKIDNLNITSQKITFETNNNSSLENSFLVISQNFDSGWKLKVDNQFQDITKTNHTFIGIFLTPGNHQIILEYRPNTFFFCLKLAIISAITSFLVILIKIFRTKS